MKVLLDENLDYRLRRLRGAHDVYTVDYMGWAGLQNGELLHIAEAGAFEILITGDTNLSYQQNLTGRHIAIVTLSAIDLDILKANLKLIIAAIDSLEEGAVIRLECRVFDGNTPNVLPYTAVLTRRSG